MAIGDRLMDTDRDKALVQSTLAGLIPGGLIAASLMHDQSKPKMSDWDINRLRSAMKIRPEVVVARNLVGGPSYNPAEDLVRMSGSQSLGVLAHELGHSSLGQSKFRKLLSSLPEFLVGAPLAGALAVHLAPSEEWGTAAAAAVPVVLAPTLIEEAIASGKGYRGMRGIGKGVFRSLAAAKGLPTYVAAAGVPALQHVLQKRMGVYEKDASAMEKEAISQQMLNRAIRNRNVRKALWGALGRAKGITDPGELAQFVARRAQADL